MSQGLTLAPSIDLVLQHYELELRSAQDGLALMAR